MPLPLIAFVMVLIVIAVAGISCSRPSAGGSGAPAPITRQAMRSLSKEELQKKLDRIEKNREPEPKMGAMCYDMALPPDRYDYTCPQCGEKTLYTNNQARALSWELEGARREFDLLKKASELDVTLDETSFCSHCAPAATEHRIALTITFQDGTRHTAAPVSTDDLRLLRGFLAGKLSYQTFNESEEPLKPQADRIRTLLGLDAHD